MKIFWYENIKFNYINITNYDNIKQYIHYLV